MKKLLYVTNIPTPYRQKRFNMMAEIFPKYGIDFEVLYMAKIEPNRKWIIAEETFNYKYKIFNGIHPVIGRFFAHFNPSLLLRLLKNDYDIAVVGGMASPTHWFAPFFIRGKKVQIMSIESNLKSVEVKNGFGAVIKRILLTKANGYQITGLPQKEYITYFLPTASYKPFIFLPNLIDEDIFKNQVGKLKIRKEDFRREFGVTAEMQMWVLPARLENSKGILPFLNLIRGLENINVFILGDGNLKNDIAEYISLHNLPVIIVGFVQQDEVLKYYAAADLFVLPSLKDPSPLSPIEAIAAGLPILVSSRIGNHDDVLRENFNGWSYDPINEIEIGINKLNIISNMNRADLARQGVNSSKIYLENFDNESRIVSYANQLNHLINGKVT